MDPAGWWKTWWRDVSSDNPHRWLLAYQVLPRSHGLVCECRSTSDLSWWHFFIFWAVQHTAKCWLTSAQGTTSLQAQGTSPSLGSQMDYPLPLRRVILVFMSAVNRSVNIPPHFLTLRPCQHVVYMSDHLSTTFTLYGKHLLLYTVCWTLSSTALQMFHDPDINLLSTPIPFDSSLSCTTVLESTSNCPNFQTVIVFLKSFVLKSPYLRLINPHICYNTFIEQDASLSH